MLRTPGGVVGETRDATTPSDCFLLFFTNDMVTKITNYTNLKIETWLASLSENQRNTILHNNKYSHVRKTDIEELNALVGLFFFRALLNQNFTDYERLWNPVYSHVVFSSIMSLKRFKFLLRFLRKTCNHKIVQIKDWRVCPLKKKKCQFLDIHTLLCFYEKFHLEIECVLFYCHHIYSFLHFPSSFR